jgi:hypothetical protein
MFNFFPENLIPILTYSEFTNNCFNDQGCHFFEQTFNTLTFFSILCVLAFYRFVQIGNSENDRKLTTLNLLDVIEKCRFERLLMCYFFNK